MSNLPLIADADTGFGEGEMVRRTVEDYCWAGAAGLHIEDQERRPFLVIAFAGIPQALWSLRWEGAGSYCSSLKGRLGLHAVKDVFVEKVERAAEASRGSQNVEMLGLRKQHTYMFNYLYKYYSPSHYLSSKNTN